MSFGQRASWVGGIVFGVALAATATGVPPPASSIRSAHLTRLDERMSTSVEDLKEQCRFESDISTAPSAGVVALTFDDGPDAEHTRDILATLDRYQVPGTFFVIGEKAERHPELVRSIQESGRHLVGSHTWSHPNFHDLAPEAQRVEIDRGIDALPDARGRRLFRYPYGNASCPSNEYLHERGYAIVGWHVDSCDWAFDRTGTVEAKEALSCGVSPQFRADFVGHVASSLRARRGGIVLLHEIHDITAVRLAELIEEIRRDGFNFVRLDDPRLADSLR
jgi:peptidoglycan-N-acetylglucosamine deacetylase